ncbi:hypothetical protein FEM48_Zijuj03G0014500 [Ziziphus jujuba var. spinosa]|uniref:Sulfotransferase n=1 Tax=Ziziphus jujuba var. spinosa TaxID=714518 RepID=A0A978VMC8_ZIZJJ|nr:cytosolic sulfotransferase 15-like [Ziziphus jujuba var. spinosa]KAH7536703.1 hypothetical protein FEM48_Zijuj03G0014500 [Ziziphus jujuba var. spinosa]
MESSQRIKESEELLLSLPKVKGPKVKGWLDPGLSLYQGFYFYCPSKIVPNIISFQNHFQVHDQDIILASKPKSGTTWLKAHVFSIVNRKRCDQLSNCALLKSNLHELVPFMEFSLYANNQLPHFSTMAYLRLFSTHIPYESLPESIKQTNCRIVYIRRNPHYIIVSHWHFANQACLEHNTHWTVEEFAEAYCKGEEAFGPFWDHMLGYHKMSKENTNRVLFLKYEELKKDTLNQVKKLAEFIGFPFSKEEDSQGIVDEILKLRSFGNLKELDVNKHGKLMPYFENKSYFRKGEIGDWVNHLSDSMVEKLNKVIHEKLNGSGLTFKENC